MAWKRRKPDDERLWAVSVTGGVWERTDTIGLAHSECSHCCGLGVIFSPRLSWGGATPCACVYRAIFRICCRRYMRTDRSSWQYRADFYLIAKRELKRSDWDIFKLRYIRGWDWKRCTRALQIDRGLFFHRVYVVQEQLGQVYRELRPYALFPIDKYFTPAARNEMRFVDISRNGRVSRRMQNGNVLCAGAGA
ncbi:hypothetical protein LCGC14_1330400 [marine sediment metagenome]|uniref:Uncharacterized protein n=1 Tax=marine sediment metagenome TaxID=412755 RepID=A0A0F9L2R8_9ZZZZ